VTEVPDPGRPRRSEWLGALVVFLGLTVAMNWPMAAHPRGFYTSPQVGDFCHGYWNYWRTAHEIFRGEGLFHTRTLFHPDGISMMWTGYEMLPMLASAPVTRLFGPAVSFNLVFLITFVIAGMGAWLLGRHLTGSSLAGLGAGIAYAFTPLHFLSYKNEFDIHVEWLPFLFWSLLRFRDRGKLRDAILAGVWLGFTALSSMYYAVFTGLALAAFVLWFSFAASGRPVSRRVWVRGILVCIGVGALVAAIRIVPMVLDALGTVQMGRYAEKSGDLAGFKVRVGAEGTRELLGWPALFGYIVVLGALLGSLGRGRRGSGFWWFLAGVFFLTALGPSLVVAGRTLSWVPMPAHFLQKIPLLTELRGFHRARIVVLLALAVLFARFLASLSRRASPVWSSALLVLLLVEFWPPRAQAVDYSVPPFYDQLRREEGNQAVLVVPFDGEVDANVMLFPMFLQTRHEKPLIAGYYSRLDPVQRRKLLDSPFLASLMAPDPAHPTHPFSIPDEETAARDRRELRAWGVGTVILNPQYLASPTASGERKPSSVRKEPIAFRPATWFAPFWWGPMVLDRAHAPMRGGTPEREIPAKQRWMDPSVEPYLEAVLGKPERTLEDGSIVWRVR